MGLGGIFKKIGKGLWAGTKKIDAAGDWLEKLPGGKNLLILIPVVGAAARMAVEEIDNAERIFSGRGSGEEKLKLALERILARLEEAISTRATGEESSDELAKEAIGEIESFPQKKELETLIEAMLLVKGERATVGELGEVTGK